MSPVGVEGKVAFVDVAGWGLNDETWVIAQAELRADPTLTAKAERQAAVIADLKDQIATLGPQRQRWLGTQLNADATIDPVVYGLLRITNERLTAHDALLMTQVAELRRINTTRQSYQVASRQAHAKDVANLLTDTDASVTTTGVTAMTERRRDAAPTSVTPTVPTNVSARSAIVRPTALGVQKIGVRLCPRHEMNDRRGTPLRWTPLPTLGADGGIRDAG